MSLILPKDSRKCSSPARAPTRWGKWLKPCWESLEVASTISRLNQSLTQQFETWRQRRLQEHWHGLEKLEASGEKEAARRAHASYYLRLAEDAEKEIRGPRQTMWLQRLEREHDNLRAAFQWSLEQGEAGQGMEMALLFSKALERFWKIRGHYSEGRTFLKRALAASKGSLTSMRASALNIAAGLAVA
jgi:hypothetical protein